MIFTYAYYIPFRGNMTSRIDQPIFVTSNVTAFHLAVQAAIEQKSLWVSSKQ